MSSYGFLARLSNIESNTDDLQTSIDNLGASKQDVIDNAPVVGGQAIKAGPVLNKIGTKDTTQKRPLVISLRLGLIRRLYITTLSSQAPLLVSTKRWLG